MDNEVKVYLYALNSDIDAEAHQEFYDITMRCQQLAEKLNSPFYGYTLIPGQDGHPFVSFQGLPPEMIEEEIAKLGGEKAVQLPNINIEYPNKKEYDRLREQFTDKGIDVAKMLKEAEPIDAKILPVRAFFLVSLLQVALRHPALQHERFAYEIGMDMAKGLQAKLTEIHPNLGKILEMGWLPEYDHKYPIKTEEPSLASEKLSFKLLVAEN